MAGYGAFVDLEGGVTGLLHAKEMVTEDGSEANPAMLFPPGKEVTVRAARRAQHPARHRHHLTRCFIIAAYGMDCAEGGSTCKFQRCEFRAVLRMTNMHASFYCVDLF